jgi:hypothetical protein
MHFRQPRSTFVQLFTEIPEARLPSKAAAIRDRQINFKRLQKDHIKSSVDRFIKRKTNNPLGHYDLLQIGDLCLRKRTFLRHAAIKTQFKVYINIYEIIERVATNAFQICDIKSNGELICTGDHLIRLRYGRTEAIQLLNNLERSREQDEKATFVRDHMASKEQMPQHYQSCKTGNRKPSTKNRQPKTKHKKPATENQAKITSREFSMAVEINGCAGVFRHQNFITKTNQSARYQTKGYKNKGQGESIINQ